MNFAADLITATNSAADGKNAVSASKNASYNANGIKSSERSAFLSELAAALSSLGSDNLEGKNIHPHANDLITNGENNSSEQEETLNDEASWEYSGEAVSIMTAQSENIVYRNFEDLLADSFFDPYELAEQYTNNLLENEDLPSAEKFMEYYKETLEAVKNILSWTIAANSSQTEGVKIDNPLMNMFASSDGAEVKSIFDTTSQNSSQNHNNTKFSAAQAQVDSELQAVQSAVRSGVSAAQTTEFASFAHASKTAENANVALQNNAMKSEEATKITQQTIDADEVLLEKSNNYQKVESAESAAKNSMFDNKGSEQSKFASIFKDSNKTDIGKEHAASSQNNVNTENTAGKAQAEQSQSRSVERVLQWESAKDAVNLAKMVQQAGQNGATKLTVRLTPENLGKIEIQLTEINGRIDAKLSASNHESKAILASHGEAIRQNLLERGIHIDNMDFSFNDSLQKQSEQSSEENHKQTNGKSGQTKADNNAVEKEESSPSVGLYA